MRDNLVAIHQPNFFPWLGYFDKIRRADHFIFLDDVQFPKTGGAWTNRVKILQMGEARWLTAPIDRNYSGTRRITEMRFASGDPWREKAVKSLTATYAKAPRFKQTMELVVPLLTNPSDAIADYNIHAISVLSSVLGFTGKSMSRSADAGIATASTERLVDLVQAVGGTRYLCGGGAEGYQEDHLFQSQGLGLVYQNFVPKPYRQIGETEFVPGLSIIDALMNLGTAGVADLLSQTD